MREAYLVVREAFLRDTFERINIMPETQINLEWESTARRKYETMITKIPLFHREIAKQVVDKKAVINAQNRNSDLVQEQDIVRAFLSEVPKAFLSLMMRLMDEVEFDYRKYEN